MNINKLKPFLFGILITIGVIVLMGATQSGEVGRYQIATAAIQLHSSNTTVAHAVVFIVDTKTGIVKKVGTGELRERNNLKLNKPFQDM